MSKRAHRARGAAGQGGFSLVELMVVLVLSLFVSLAIFVMLTSAEGRKRTLTSVNDINQAGAFASYVLDKQLRSAGSGFMQSSALAFGCRINASKAATQILPAVPAAGATNALPDPFGAVSARLPGGAAGLAPFRLAPVVIVKNGSKAGSDVLIVMTGNAGYGERATQFALAPTASALNVINSVGFNGNDIVLAFDQNAGANIADCMIQQVSGSFAGGVANAIPLAGDYYAASGATVSLTALSANGQVVNLGNVGNGNAPAMVLLGVGDNNVLYSADLLQVNGATATNVADGVFEMHALYGIDAAGTGVVSQWADPGTAPYDPATLLNGTTASATRLRSIKAIRIGLIMRTALPEKTAVTTSPITLFSDLPAAVQYTRTLLSTAPAGAPTGTAPEQNFRYRVIESTIPIRNALF